MKSKSFCIDKKTKHIFIYAGDTASMTVKVRGYDFQASDRALFTVSEKDSGEAVIEKVFTIVNNRFSVPFHVEDTNWLDPEAEYEWDVRFIVDPEYDEHGKIVSRDWVTTPGSPYKFTVKKNVGRNV